MHPMKAKIRLFVDHPLGKAQSVPLDRDQANYIFAVIRLSVGDQILLINGRDGEWLATLNEGNKRSGEALCLHQTRPLQTPPDLWLVFAPIKKARTDFIVEKRPSWAQRRFFLFRQITQIQIASNKTGCRPMRLKRPNNAVAPMYRRFMI